MEALIMEPDIETLIISEITIHIAKDWYLDLEDGVEDSDDDNNNEHDNIYGARSCTQWHHELQQNDNVKIEDDEDDDEYED